MPKAYSVRCSTGALAIAFWGLGSPLTKEEPAGVLTGLQSLLTPSFLVMAHPAWERRKDTDIYWV